MSSGIPDLGVSRETRQRLTIYVNELRRWSGAINLVSRNSLRDVWQRHIADSLQLGEYAETDLSWADLGSGGGLPGIPLAILGKWNMTLVESDRRKAEFLRHVIRLTGARAVVRCERVEELEPLQAEIVSARALAPLRELVGYADRHMVKDGSALFLKGASAKEEIQEAKRYWQFSCEAFASRTDSTATVLRVREISRA